MTTLYLFDVEDYTRQKSENAAKKSPTQLRREKVATITQELAAITRELAAERIETTGPYNEGKDGANSAIQEIFATLKKGKDRDAEIDQTIVTTAETILDAYHKGYLKHDTKQRNGSLGALSALALFLQEQVPPF